MNNTQLLNDLEQLPPEALEQIENFVAFIKCVISLKIISANQKRFKMIQILILPFRPLKTHWNFYAQY